MIQSLCPKCKHNLEYLISRRECTEYTKYRTEDWYGDADYGDYGDESFHCPNCGYYLCSSLDEADRILKPRL